MREKPNIKGRATLHFPLWIAENEMRPYFAEALEILDEFWNPHPIFPLEEFRQHACKAILFAGIGRINEAKTEAFLAMSAAQKTESKARYHRSTGLITDSDLPLVNRMKNLSASKQSLPSWISALFKGKK